MSSPDNPPTEPQPLVSAEPQAPVASSPDAFAPAPPPPPPVENPVWSGWDVLLIACLAFVSMLILQFIVLMAAHWLAYPRLSLPNVALEPIVLLVSQFLIYLPIAACMILLVEGKYHVPFWQAIRWNWPSRRWGFVALALGGVTLVVLATLQNLLPMPKDTPFEHMFDRPRDAYLLSLIAITLGPLMEELFFRGFLYPVLARRLGMVWGVVLSALPFGLIHLPQYGWAWAAGFVIFLVGVVCGVVRATTKSVGTSFLVHVGYNGTQMLIALVATDGFRHMEKATFASCWPG